MSAAYFICVLVICSVFLLNLTIAFLLGNYSSLDKAAGFSSAGNKFLMKMGQSLGLPDKLVDELIEIDPSGIKLRKSRRKEILAEAGLGEHDLDEHTKCEILWMTFIWDKKVI